MLDLAEEMCRRAATASEEELANIVKLADGLVAGTERVAPPPIPGASEHLRSDMPVREFGEFWTSNELAREFRRDLKVINHKDNISRLKNWIYPVEFDGTEFGDLPLNEVVKAHGNVIKKQESLSEGSVWKVAQILHRMFALAVDPADLLERSPFPATWLPLQNPKKAKSHLYPSDDGALMVCPTVPLVKRLFIGFCLREGPRVDNVVRLGWHDFEPDLDAEDVFAVIDKTKPGKQQRWRLEPSTAEALRRWRKLCPSERWVFPASAVPRHRKKNAHRPMHVGKAAKMLRDALLEAGVDRPRLHEATPDRLRLRAHDMRVTFVTLSLAQEKPEEWIRKRTGHSSSEMIARYREEAETLAEAKKMGKLKPLCDAIPELAVWGDSPVMTQEPPTDNHPKKTSAPHLTLIEGGAGKRQSG